MRPLKPFVMAVSGLITALFSVVFLGAHPGPAKVAPVTTPQPDLQAKSVAPNNELAASRDAKPASKTPAVPLYSPTADLADSETLRFSWKQGASLPHVVVARIVDRRALSLVGIVELRI